MISSSPAQSGGIYKNVYKVLVVLTSLSCHYHQFQLSSYCLSKAIFLCFLLSLHIYSIVPTRLSYRATVSATTQPLQSIDQHSERASSSLSCVFTLSNALRSAIASTTTTQYNHVLTMVIETTELKRGWSLSATPVPTIQCIHLSLPQVRVIIPTLDTPPGQADRDVVRVGDEREYYTGFPLRTQRSAQAAGESDLHLRRWQYALRVSTSVSGAPCAWP